MTVKTGTAWAGTFVTQDATGALATPSAGPAGVLYVDGTADAAEVTITGSNPYKFAVTLPSLTAGQRVDMYITATIATIATAGFVASEQSDTYITSDIETLVDGLETMLTDIHDTDLPAVKSDTAAILTDTGTDGVKVASLANDSITAAALKTDAVDELVDAVWDEAISGHTTATTFGGKNQKVVPSETINDYKADVSGLATSTALSTVSGLVDDLETRLTAARAGYLDNLNTGVALTSAGIDAIMDEVVVGSYTMRQLLTVFASALAGKLSGGGTTTLTFRGINDASNVIVATVDANGNRSDLTITV